MSTAAIALGASYQIYVHNGRGWQGAGLHDNRLAALDEAKGLTVNGRYPAVKVIREEFDERSQLFVERTVYRAGKAPDAEQRQRQAANTFRRLGDRNRERKTREANAVSIRHQARRASLRKIIFAAGLSARLAIILGGGVGLLYWILTQY